MHAHSDRLSPGQYVQLFSGGRVMVVQEVGAEVALCCWSEGPHVRTGSFSKPALKVVFDPARGPVPHTSHSDVP